MQNCNREADIWAKFCARHLDTEDLDCPRRAGQQTFSILG
jgi:hypothetical protein